MRKEFRSLIPLQEAKSIILDRLPRIQKETIPLECSRGRILAEKIVSDVDVPGFHRASMDGYAVRAADTLESREDRPVSLRLAGCVPMGTLPDVRVDRGEAAEVSTGSMMPDGADSVVMIEYAQAKDDRIYIRRPVYCGENVQKAGSDISFGELVLFPGTRITSREAGVLAALGRETVLVLSLKVGLASTGGELVPPGHILGPGQIYDINTYTIAAGVHDCGASAVTYGILPDEREKMAKTLQKMAHECEMVLVSGSTSAGAGDMVYQVLDEIGELIFHGVNLKPGKPTIFGLIDNTPCLGLPGYPTSALTVFYELAAPVIRRALGQRHQGNRIQGRLAGPLRTEGRQQMLAVGVSGEVVYPVDKGSGSITTLALADGVIEIPSGVEYLEKDTLVDVKLFRDLQVPNLIVAGENSVILERLAERLPWRLMLLNAGSLLGRIYLEDRVADLASISDLDTAPIPTGMQKVMGYKRELGLIYRDTGAISDPNCRIVGWNRDSAMKVAFERALLDLGITNPRYVRAARTHSAVAAAVASGRADLGFAERAAAIDAGLGFKFLIEDEMQFLARSGSINNPWLKSFIDALLPE